MYIHLKMGYEKYFTKRLGRSMNNLGKHMAILFIIQSQFVTSHGVDGLENFVHPLIRL